VIEGVGDRIAVAWTMPRWMMIGTSPGVRASLARAARSTRW
jgi:hypothetical protein